MRANARPTQPTCLAQATRWRHDVDSDAGFFGLVVLVVVVVSLIARVSRAIRERAEIEARTSGRLVFSEDHVRIAHTGSRLGSMRRSFTSGYVRITGNEAFIMFSGGPTLRLSFHRYETTDPKPPGEVLDVVAVTREKHGVVIEGDVRFGSRTLRVWPRDPESMFVALQALKRQR